MEDDGIMLNLTPYVPKGKVKTKTDNKKIVSNLQKNKDVSYEKERKPKPSSSSKNRTYIDPKDFTPISTLFNKNPEIPSAPEVNVSEKRQDVVFTSDKIAELPVNDRLRNNLKDQFKLSSLTKVQTMSVPKLLQGLDVLIKSPTGSGKTFCYAVPIIEKLSTMEPPVNRIDGAYAVVIVPTRELAFQTFNVIQDLCKSCISIVPGLLIGGEKCKSEKARIRKGINIVIATPGRLAYHLKETKSFDVSKVMFLVLDEADKLLDMGFLKTMTEIVDDLDNRGSVKRQSVLLSATLTKDIQSFASLALHDSAFVDSEANEENIKTETTNQSDYIIPSSLQQQFITVPAKLRLVTLLSFLANKVFVGKSDTKVMIFVSSINSVSLLNEVLKIALKNFFDAPVEYFKNIQTLHGDMSQPDRLKAFEEFKKSSFGVMICTDVAARGLDIKGVDWIVQYSCPNQIEDYLHRVGRTARIGEKGESVMFILPSEIKYISLLSSSNVVLNELKMQDVLVNLLKKSEQKGNKIEAKVEAKATDLQACIEEAVTKSKELQQVAVQAYKSFIQSYATYPTSQKHIFHVKYLHLGHLAKSFGLREAPKKMTGALPTKAFERKRKFEEEKDEKEKAKKRKIKRDAEMADGIFTGPKTKKQQKLITMKKKKNNIAKKGFAGRKKKKIRI